MPTKTPTWDDVVEENPTWDDVAEDSPAPFFQSVGPTSEITPPRDLLSGRQSTLGIGGEVAPTTPEQVGQAFTEMKDYGVDTLAQGGFGLPRGISQLGNMAWSAAQTATEPIVSLGPISITALGPQFTPTARATAEGSRELAKEATKQAQPWQELSQETGGAKIAGDITSGLVSAVPALAAGPGGLPAVIATAGAQGGLSTLSDAQSYFEQMPEERRKTFFPNPEFWSAASPAALDALQTAAITLVSGKLFGSGLEGVTAPVKREAIKSTIGRKAVEALGEGVEEGTQQFISDYVIARMVHNPDITFDEAFDGAIKAGVAGGVIGAGLGAVRGASVEQNLSPKDRAARALSQQMDNAQKLDLDAINRQLETEFDRRQGERRVGVRIPEGEFAQPGRMELASEALSEAQSPLEVPGRTPAIERLRKDIEGAGIETAQAPQTKPAPGGVLPSRERRGPVVVAGEEAQRDLASRAGLTQQEIDASDASLSLAAEAGANRESVLEMSPDGYFDLSRQWASEAMAGNGETVQVQAELAALRDPNLEAWQAAYDQASREAQAIRDEVKANPASMADPAVQKRFSGAAQKTQFFSEGLKVLKGAEPDQRTKAALAKGPSLSAEPTPYEMPNPVGIEKVQEVVTKFKKDYPGARPVNIARDYNEMPDSVQQASYSQGGYPWLVNAAVTADGQVWINAANMVSEAQVIEELLHENAGHWATDKQLGKRLNQFMGQVADSFNNHPLMEEVRAAYGKGDRVRHGREFVARIAQAPESAPNVWKQIVAKFRQWLRDIGWVKTVSENDIKVLLNRSLENLRKIEAGMSPEEASLSLRTAAEIAAERYPNEGTEKPVVNKGKTPNTVDAIKALKEKHSESVIRRAFANYQSTRYGMDAEKASTGVKGTSLALFAKEVARGEPRAVAAIESASLAGSEVSRESETLDDVYRIFEPSPKVRPSLKERGVQFIEAIRTGVSSKFRPLNKLAEDIGKAYGRTTPRNIAGIMEQLNGSQGKGEADIYRFDRDVSKLVEGSEKDFNAYIFLRRSLDRLNQDLADIERAQAGEEVPKLNRRAVSNYTIPQLEAKLAALERKIGPEKLAQFQTAAEAYQQHLDKSLRLQVESGRMSQEVYDYIKEGNQFYAPFKVMKYIEDSSRPEGSGRRIDTTADFTKAMEGIESPDFKLGDMLAAARQSILMSRILADKNMAMRHFAELANYDAENRFLKPLKPSDEVPRGMEAVNVLENGNVRRFAVIPEVAQALNIYGSNGASVFTRFMSKASIPFRAGATALNLPFQVSNLVADVPRQALISKYGIRGASDAIRYPLDVIHALYSSISGDVFGKDNKLFLDFLDSGVAGTTIQEYLTPEAFKFKEPTAISKSKKLASTVINFVPEFAKAIEQTSKVLGVKRAMRFEGVTSGRELAKRIPEAITELRRFSGSPDFGRQGKWIEQMRLNLIYMFLNARIQGAVADVGRLAGRDGAKQAARTWFNLTTAVGIPTAILYALNNRDENREDYEKRPDDEKRNYWLIPKDTYITNDDGERMRDYWRIPKRESSKWIANLTEAGLEFARRKDPEGVKNFAATMIEELSPVNISGDTFQERGESVAASLNPLLKAPLEMFSGRDFYRHRDIVPPSMKKASPENQFTQRTAEAFKTLAEKMPDISPEVLRSPLMLENLTKNLTAGLITQFLPRKPVEGRSQLENTPLLARFQAVPYTKNDDERDQIEGLEREAADETLTRFRAAEKLIADNKGKTLAEILSKAPVDEKLMRKVSDLYIADQNGITGSERRVLSLPVRQRAAWVADQLSRYEGTAKQEKFMELARKRILTEAVYQELATEMQQ
jgi:hypothetical protein